MKSVLLILMTLLPAAVFAQQNGTVVLTDPQDASKSEMISSALAKNAGSATEGAPVDADSTLLPASAPESSDPQSSRQAPVPATNEGPESHKIEGSMVGYIDDAIIGSQIRLRFEAGLDDETPDLGEFFYAKCGCYNQLASNPAFDPKAPGPGPGVVTNLNFQQLYMYGEYAFTTRFSLFTEIPIRWIQPTSFNPFGTATVPNAAGLSDIRAGFKLAAIDSANATLTIQVQGYFPSGKASAGLGTHHYSIEPAILYYQRFSRRVTLEAQIGDWHPIGGSAGVPPAAAQNSSGEPTTDTGGFAGDVLFYGIGPSYKIYNGEHFGLAPVLEMVGWRVIRGYETVWVSGTDIANSVAGINLVNLKIGARVTFGSRNSIYVGYGRAITDAYWYKKIVRAEYRYTF